MTNSIRCPLLELPAELRNPIYEHLLLPDDEEDEVDVTRESKRRIPWEQPAILKTCRQLRAEAIPIYYANNIFYFAVESRTLSTELVAWYPMLDDVARKHIRGIRLGLVYNDYESARRAFDFWYETLRDAGCDLPEGILNIQVMYTPGVITQEYVWTNRINGSMAEGFDELGFQDGVNQAVVHHYQAFARENKKTWDAFEPETGNERRWRCGHSRCHSCR